VIIVGNGSNGLRSGYEQGSFNRSGKHSTHFVWDRCSAKSGAWCSASTRLRVETFDDWSVVCGKSVKGPGGIVSPNERLCEVVTVITKTGETAPFVRISLFRQEIVKPIRMVAIVPAAVAIPTGLSFTLAPGIPSVNLNYKFCAMYACVAEGEIPQEQMVTLQDPLLIGNLTFSDPNGNKIEVKVSFKGLIQALNVMQK
jgi:invasion protein IalB